MNVENNEAIPNRSKNREKIPAVEIYFFKDTFINEYNAFAKYYSAIRENGYISRILKEVENMRDSDYCELYAIPNEYQNDQINLFFNPLPPDESNTKILYASDSIELRNTAERGRHLVSKKRIPRNKIIVNEYPTIIQVEPLCTCVGNPQSIYRCHNCGLACKQFYTCDGCNVCIFCSRNCMSFAYKNYHKFECYGLQRHFWSMEDTDYSYLAFRLMLYGASMEFNTDIQDSSCHGSFRNNYPFIYKLETNFTMMSLAQINKILYSATKNLLYLITKTTFFNLFKNRSDLEDIYEYIGGLMVKHYCQAQMNNIILKYPNMTLGCGLDVISGTGKAICPTISLLNHSCSPNAVIVVCSEYLVVKSIKPIKAGEEITICYSEVNSLLMFEERQLITREILFFSCKCSFCEFEKKSIESPYKCPLCVKGSAKQIDKSEGKHIGYCTDCDNVFPMDSILQTLKAAAFYRGFYKTTFSMEHIEKVAECYSDIFPKKSLYLLDVYRLIYEKNVVSGEKPLEALKYGILSFKMIEQCLSRLYLPILIAKVKFMFCFVEMKHFSKIRRVTPEEHHLLLTLVGEVVKVKKDLLFYLSPEKIQFYECLELRIHEMYQCIKVIEDKGN